MKESVTYVFWNPPETACYIGMTVNFEQRKKSHARDAERGSKLAFHRAIRKYGGIENFRAEVWPTGLIAKDRKGLGEMERAIIAKFRAMGIRLYNMTDGGEGGRGYKHTDEWVAKMRAMNLGKVLSAETRAKISAANKGRKPTAEARAKMSAAQTGRKHSAETKAKIGAGNKGKRVSDESRAKMSAAQKGRVTSAETRAKISAAGKGRVVPAEVRARMSAAAQATWTPERRAAHSKIVSGRQVSAETREKLRQANLGKTPSRESVEKTRQANLGRKHTAQAKANMAVGVKKSWEKRSRVSPLRGSKMSAESRAKMRAAWTPERKARLAEQNRSRRTTRTPGAMPNQTSIL